MFRREQNSADTALKRDRRTINGKIRLLTRLGDALFAAKVSGGDIAAAVEAAIGWEDHLGREIDEAPKLIRPDAVDPVTIAATNYPVLRQVGPSFIASVTFGAVRAAMRSRERSRSCATFIFAVCKNCLPTRRSASSGKLGVGRSAPAFRIAEPINRACW